ncbi:putative 37S ribosomal protein S18, mitochondrial [Ceratocystis fimbriata CBS 114723]|uniref:Putative 37S ribosomal protein S18, mitochondrial n=1 Tax=Ceratocystis fimbriata CBS 114723 TaxID=1035309 RepID=A0A2C5X4V7_9PEZI|nr:putative 37S ribosomal protein S18, mitochondrial [Ceratocystis fimbriata CBS 114723]
MASLQRSIQPSLALRLAVAPSASLVINRPFSYSIPRTDETQKPTESPATTTITASDDAAMKSSGSSSSTDTPPKTAPATEAPTSTSTSSTSSTLSSPLAHLYPSPKEINDFPPSTASEMRKLSHTLFAGVAKANSTHVQDADTPLTDAKAGEDDTLEPFHFHVYSHKHNTHITVTRPNRNPIISMSCGNIGIRKSRRKNYDAAYQLTAYVLERLYHEGWQEKIKNLEVVLKGFGAGREAATKVLLGQEGKLLADKIIRVSDATKIKFGGTRSKNPRRI